MPKHRIVGVDVRQTGCLFNFRKRTYVTFKLKKPKEAWIGLPLPTMSVKMRGLADANVMFDYVYGALQGMKDKAQVLAHLLEDDLVEKGDFSVDTTLTPSAENTRRA